jgi:hypothetical protein
MKNSKRLKSVRKSKINCLASSIGKSLETQAKNKKVLLTSGYIKYIFGNWEVPSSEQATILNLELPLATNWKENILGKEITKEELIKLLATNPKTPRKNIFNNTISKKKVKKKSKKAKHKSAPIVSEEIVIKKLSNAALQIVHFLKNNRINYVLEKYFSDCINPKTGMMLPFDFYLPDLNVCIEYDGEQHFKYVPEFHGLDKIKGLNLLNKQKERDEVKNKYCAQRNVDLIRIKYKDNIIKFLETKLKNRI